MGMLRNTRILRRHIRQRLHGIQLWHHTHRLLDHHQQCQNDGRYKSGQAHTPLLRKGRKTHEYHNARSQKKECRDDEGL